MLKWGFVYFLLAVACGILGVMDTQGALAGLAQIFFFGNVVLFVVFTMLGSIGPQVSEYPATKAPHQD